MSYKKELETKNTILLSKMKYLVEEDNNAASAFDSLCNSCSSQPFSPVKNLENMLGISGIYKKYNFPENIEPEDYEMLAYPANIFQFDERANLKSDSKKAYELLEPVKEKSFQHIKNMYTALVKLNPELKEIEIKKEGIYPYIAIISGACSGFPSEDIKLYIDDLNNDNPNKIGIDTSRREYSSKIVSLIKTKGKPNNSKAPAMLEKRLENGDIFKNWCPTKNTFDKVYKKLDSNLEYQKIKVWEIFTSNRFAGDD